MPTEQISRYFHIASRERSERWKQISGALTSVVASTATQRSPKLRAVMTSVIVERNASMQEMNTESRWNPAGLCGCFSVARSAGSHSSVWRLTNKNSRDVMRRKIVPASSSPMSVPIHFCPRQQKEAGLVLQTAQTVRMVWQSAVRSRIVRISHVRLPANHAARAAANGIRISRSRIISRCPPRVRLLLQSRASHPAC